MGATVQLGQDKVSICAKGMHCSELVRYNFPIRTTYLLVAAQLMRRKTAYIPYPGGCNIGNRKHDLHIMVWEKMGGKVQEKENHIQVLCDKLKGTEISFPFPTIGGTENAILCGAIAEGVTVIRNAYVSPEVEDLIGMLRSMGADIETTGNSRIVIKGTKSLRGTSYRVMPDRIEALTWIIYAVLSGGKMLIQDVPFESIKVPLIHLQEAGVDLFRNQTSVYISPDCLITSQRIQPFEVATGTHPGVISDMQPFFVLLALFADGISQIVDYRYPERTAYLAELNKICNNAIKWDRNGHITVTGGGSMSHGEMISTDLRGSMALLLGGLLGDGISDIHQVDLAMRGYNNLANKLESLGISLSLEEE
jgi:UDP-N-acetylglucosamine 1-carboxyvinyltransferase